MLQGWSELARTGGVGSARAEGFGRLGGKVAQHQRARCLHRLSAPDQEALPELADLQAMSRSIRLSGLAETVLDPMLPQEGRELPPHGGAVLAVYHVPSRAEVSSSMARTNSMLSRSMPR